MARSDYLRDLDPTDEILDMTDASATYYSLPDTDTTIEAFKAERELEASLGRGF